jgi:hypothetical protein
MLRDLCKCNDIVFVQEHWLLPDSMSIITSWDTSWDCHVVSGITDIESYALKGGRPYGGIGFMWRRSTSLKVKLIGVDDLHRVMAVEVTIGSKMFVIIGVYFPCYANNDEYEGDVMVCVGFIESILALYQSGVNCTFLMLGDSTLSAPGFVIVKDLLVCRIC